ncbi:Glucosyl-3-phosphoglycerate synthase [Pirellulimonas nuda]|uniref:Glucosyl-3-phosphoglycerate synthase n=1 Tax=Pirellulimonas nuda TaxID=2528009 RepID=A0A518DB59_9BACT|nr:TIGR04283 family arsenosugar biosynthesis glycosyltransferase [Pirellulimonas nuda]QDU88708.1 Glucosyl-3-phosphoglycerate synthase [Pirellulimonas nuda]
MRTVSVVIPALNEADLVAAAVQSAFACGVGEVVVADGGSSDNTPGAADRAGARVIGAPRGRGSQLAAGAAAATGEVLWFLHADCRLDPLAGGQLARVLEDPRCLAGAFRQRIDSQRPIYRWIERGNAWRARRGLPYGDQAVFVRRGLFEAVGGFPTAPLMEDVALARKIAKRTRFTLLSGPVYISARRWERSGPLRRTAFNWALLAAYSAGAPAEQIARWYHPHQADE